MSLKQDIQNQIKQQIRDQMISKQPKEKTFGGFVSGFKEDITSFGKGLLGLGREAVLHPVESAKTVGSTALELGKQTALGVPSYAKQVGDIVAHPIKTTKELINNYQNLRAIPYQDQKKLFKEFSEDVMESTADGGKGKKILGALGAGLIGDVAQEITHPVEFAYEKPFTFGLDVLSMGGGKLMTKGTRTIAAPLKETKLATTLGDLFVPNAKLIREGYGGFARDLQKTNTNIFNSQQNIIRSTAEKFEKTFNLGSKERLEFFDTVDELRRAEPGVKAVSQNPKIQKAIDWWLDEQVPKIRKAAGVTEGESITNYLHHFFPEKIKQAEKAGTPFKIKTGFLKKSEDVLGFSKDPIVSISAIKSKLAVNAMKDGFIKRTAKKFGETVDALEAQLIAKVGSDTVDKFKKAGNLDDLIRKQLNIETFSAKAGEKVYLPRTIAEELNHVYGKNKVAETVNKLLTPLDVFNRNWKPLATAVRPRYHTRNVVGNLYNSVVLGSMNIKEIPKAAMQQLGGYINDAKKGTGATGKIAKTLFPGKFDTKILQQAIKDDVIGRGFFSIDLHGLSQAATMSEDIVKTINRVKNPAEIYKIPILRQYLNASFNIGQALEDNARLSLYMDRIKKGLSRSDAKDYVNKHLFDYLSGLGEADKLIKKFIPFWSWTRFNLPLQAESFFTKPIRQAAIQRGGKPYVEGIESKDENIQYFTEEERQQGLLKVGEVEQNGAILDKYIKTQAVLPQADLVRLVDMLKLDFSDIGVNPLVSVLRNINENKDYFGRQLERFTGEKKKFLGTTVTGKTRELLNVLPFLNELNKGVGGSYTEEDKPSLPVRLEQILSPLGTTLKDPEEIKFFGLLEKEKELKGNYEAGLEALYKRYLIKSNKSPDEKVFKENVEQLEKILTQKGLTGLDLLPIKIKAIKQSITEKIKDDIKKKIQKANKELETSQQK